MYRNRQNALVIWVIYLFSDNSLQKPLKSECKGSCHCTGWVAVQNKLQKMKTLPFIFILDPSVQK